MMRKSFQIRIAIVFIFLFASPVWGKTLFVNASSGNDSVSYALNSEATPWATLGRATWGSTTRSSPDSSQAAAAGDTVIVYGGTYHGGNATGDRVGPTFNPANSGTPGNRITFQCRLGDICVLTHSGSFASAISTGGPIIGANARNYIGWAGFYIDARNAQPRLDTGPITVFDAIGIDIDNNTVYGMPSDLYDNNPAIRLECCADITVTNNTIHFSGSNFENTSGINSYGAQNVVVERNELYNVDAAIYPKGRCGNNNLINANWTIRYNKMHDIWGGQGIEVSSTRDSSVYQNVIYNSAADGIRVAYLEGGNVNIFNNTIDNVSGSGLTLPDNLHYNNIWGQYNLYNNIVTNAGHGANIANLAAENENYSFDYNNYYNLTIDFGYAGVVRTFSQWKTLVADDAHSYIADPQFVDRSAGNYRLAAGSPARTASITGGPVGAYITGTETIGSNNPNVSPPASVSGGGGGGGGCSLALHSVSEGTSRSRLAGTMFLIFPLIFLYIRRRIKQ